MRAFSHSGRCDPSAKRETNELSKETLMREMGWLTGIEPATTGITILGSTN